MTSLQEIGSSSEPVSLGKVNWSAGFKDAEGPTGFRIPSPRGAWSGTGYGLISRGKSKGVRIPAPSTNGERS